MDQLEWALKQFLKEEIVTKCSRKLISWIAIQKYDYKVHSEKGTISVKL